MKIVFTALLCALAMPLMASANNDKSGLADTSRVYNLDEVVVVAQPKEVLTLRKQPLSSNVFTSHEISNLGIRDLSELSRFVPSFAMPTYGSRLTSSMYIRGIGSRVNSPAVGIYVDGIPLTNKSAFNFHTYQVERVDILRGAQGTLYGMNTEGGLVRIYSKSPLLHQGTDVHLGMGTKAWRNIEIAHYGKISPNLGYSLAGFYSGQNGFFRNATTGERADRYNEAGGKLRLAYCPSARTTIDLTTDYQWVRQRAFPYGVLNTSDNSVAQPAGNRQNSYMRNIVNTGLCINHQWDRLTFNSTTSYQFLDDRMDMDQDYLPQDYMHLRQDQLMNALTQEFSLKSLNQGRWHWTSGFYGSYQWLKTNAPVFFGSDFTQRIATPVRTAMSSAIVNAMAKQFIAKGMNEELAQQQAATIVEQSGGISLDVAMSVPGLFHTPQFNLGIFHESNIDLTDRFHATIGLRYDYSNVKIDYDTQATMAFQANVMGKQAEYVLTSLLQNSHSNHFDQLLPKLGLTYTFDNHGSNIYASVSKGYRAGGYNIQMFSDILQSELTANSSKAMSGNYDVPHTDTDYENIKNTISYKPETSWNFELGAHLNLFDSRIHADLTGFYMRISNQQLSVMAGDYGFGRMMVNAGKSYSCGIEASLRGSALDNRLSWGINYGLTHAVFKDYIDNETDYCGKRVPFVPMHTLGLRADYVIMKPLAIGFDLSAQGRTYWDEANTYSQPFYAIIGFHANVKVENIGFKLWCRNLTDTHYNTFAFDSSASGNKIYLAQRGNPFQMGLDIDWQF